MTRKDYILLAEALNKARKHIAIAPVESGSADVELRGFNCTADHIAIALEADNPRFDRAHFMAVVRGEKSLTSRPGRKS